MSNIAIYLQTPNQCGLIDTLDGDLLKCHSTTIRNVLATTPTQEVTLTGAAPAALKHVLRTMKDARHPNTVLYIRVSDIPLAQAIAVHEAVSLLDVHPAQPHIEGCIMGTIAHHTVSPAEMVAVQTAYRGPESKVWMTMVHNVAFAIVSGSLKGDEVEKLNTAALPYPQLVEKVEERIDQLREGKENGRWVESQVGKGRKGRKGKGKGKGREEQGADAGWEEKNGLRELSEEQAKRLMGSW